MKQADFIRLIGNENNHNAEVLAQDIEQFQKLLLEEAMKTTPAFVPPEEFNLLNYLLVLFAGMLVLLVLSITLFSGVWAPVIWQLSTTGWVLYWAWKQLDN